MVDTEKKAENITEEIYKITDNDLQLSFTEDRHEETIEGIESITQTWRMKERMKTVSVALVLCLNVGVDPPDVVKTQPCARLECWIDPLSLSPAKALEAIGGSLQKQYERWQPRARYKLSLDPTAEEVKKLCTSLRRNAKEERVLFHYNGHGVPKPTSNGEIWVFNRSFTQYIPLSVYDLQTWMGAPSIYVYDCSNAGIIVDSFKQFALQHENEYTQSGENGTPPPTFQNCIQLAACEASQVLPMNPDLPADLFTACLTTPIKVALRWFILQTTSKLIPKVKMEHIERIPGSITDRRTMLGELNWIFTAITDTIAWNTLSRDVFQKLFRQDLLVASLFRNFLLAQRIMRSSDCTPVSSPALPETHQHPMWQAWDLTLDLSLGQLPGILERDVPYVHLPFFEEQLTAFQVWLKFGSEKRKPPEQLPIVLQVLLSQVHRMRALELLGKFLDLGPWAVNLALSVGIFPYVLKLLQSCAKELRPLLVFIWAKILAVDNTCQADLVRDTGHKYFLSILQDTTIASEHRTQAAFVLACIVNEYRDGQEAAVQGSLVSICLELLSDPCAELRQWVAICLGRLWDHYETARWTGVRDTANEKLYPLLQDPCPEVRAAAVYALGTFINSDVKRTEHANKIDHSVVMTLLNTVVNDMSPIVRMELVAAIQWVVLSFEHAFINEAIQESTRDRLRLPPSMSHGSGMDHVDSSERLKRVASSTSISTAVGLGTSTSMPYGSVYIKVWTVLNILTNDPHPDVAKISNTVINYIKNQIMDQKRDCGDIKLSSSISLPPSPNKTSFMAESPPHMASSTDLQRLATSATKLRTKHVPHTINEEDTWGLHPKKPLVTTQFVAWSCKKFAQPMMKKVIVDKDSKEFLEREWRFMRNTVIRNEGRAEEIRAQRCRLESQVFNSRIQNVPSIVQFHPYDQQIAVAAKDSFGIWDWGTGAKFAQASCKPGKSVSWKITALEWINSYDIGMVMVGSDDGSAKLWRVGQFQEPNLVTAWQAHNGLFISNRLSNSVSSGLLLSWEQYTRTVISAGDTRVLRLWDVNKELMSFDIPTGADCSVTCLDSTYSSVSHERQAYVPKCTVECDDGLFMGCAAESFEEGPDDGKAGLIVAGCADGSVRVYDRRCPPNEARIKSWMEHASNVISVQLRGEKIISGSASGDVKIYDIRKSDSLLSTQVVASQTMTGLAIHRNSNIYACSSNQIVAVHNLSGLCMNVIRFYEGFMTYRIGPVSCLGFHPYKMALATGTMDGSLSVYCLDNRR
ncbi:PREDICTED: regulatory-associated protein of mTOR isoform X2 [Nicrophorus vespilloides]|uniref:Regulatory-associated protein of mTOR isoform X2 n=1 Tax=Nicrophorus vespilloides TaxID=110193 RepID=A0ABM1N7C3_NICVS|nr:PREDICTED: regulatory-associated protein of mTOR isoform X2 [Nicrophorus vespilloides]